jgi:hypothetical protein
MYVAFQISQTGFSKQSMGISLSNFSKFLVSHLLAISDIITLNICNVKLLPLIIHKYSGNRAVNTDQALKVLSSENIAFLGYRLSSDNLLEMGLSSGWKILVFIDSIVLRLEVFKFTVEQRRQG